MRQRLSAMASVFDDRSNQRLVAASPSDLVLFREGKEGDSCMKLRFLFVGFYDR